MPQPDRGEVVRRPKRGKRREEEVPEPLNACVSWLGSLACVTVTLTCRALYAGSMLPMLPRRVSRGHARGRGARSIVGGRATISWAGPRVISWAGSHAPSCVDSYRTNQPYVLRGVVIALDVNNALSTLVSARRSLDCILDCQTERLLSTRTTLLGVKSIRLWPLWKGKGLHLGPRQELYPRVIRFEFIPGGLGLDWGVGIPR